MAPIKFVVIEIIIIIPEQFTVKAHPALFEGEGGEPKLRHYIIFQSTTDIHIQKRAQNIIPVYSWHTLSKHKKN